MLADDTRVQTTNTGVLHCVALTDDYADYAYKSTNPLIWQACTEYGAPPTGTLPLF